MKKIIILLTCTSILPTLAMAGSSENPSDLTSVPHSDMPLSLQHKAYLEVSTGIGTGNVDEENVKLAGKLTSTHDEYTNELSGDFSSLEKRYSAGSQNVYNLGDKLKYDVGGGGYAFGEGDYDNDKVIGVKDRTSELVGYGHSLLNKDNFKLTGEVGGGLRQSVYEAGREDSDSVLGKAGVDMDWEVYNNVNLNNNTYMAFTNDNTQTVSDTSIKTFLFDNAYIKGDVAVENNNDTPVGYKKTDTISSIGLGYDF